LYIGKGLSWKSAGALSQLALPEEHRDCASEAEGSKRAPLLWNRHPEPVEGCLFAPEGGVKRQPQILSKVSSDGGSGSSSLGRDRSNQIHASRSPSCTWRSRDPWTA